jgi:lipoprotein-anchoring transpeptidase ErfK/SrfK
MSTRPGRRRTRSAATIRACPTSSPAARRAIRWDPALTLSGGEQYAIHGTNRPHSIGNFATYGCIRMFNEDIIDLFDRVSVGTEVLVTL